MGTISIILNIITLVLVALIIFKYTPVKKQEEASKKIEEDKLVLKASQVFNSLLSDDNAAASNRAEQVVSKEGNIGDFTNFDAVDYEVEKHIVSYNIDDWVDKTDTNLKVMDYVTA